jgi:hypothetical protein
VANVEAITPGQSLEIIGEFAGLRYRRAIKQDRNDRDIALERGRNFDANKVILVVQAPTPLLVTCV